MKFVDNDDDDDTTLIGNPVLEVEPSGEHCHGTTGSGRNVIDLEEFTSPLSRKRRQVELWLLLNMNGNHRMN